MTHMEKTMDIRFSPPDVTEEEIQAVAEVMRSGWLTTGPKTKQLEKRSAHMYIRQDVHALIQKQRHLNVHCVYVE